MSSSSSSAPEKTGGDSVYAYNEAQITQMRKDRPWERDVKHFKNVRISALAAMKMLKHALAGVEKGRKAGTNPQEIMGLMIGKADGQDVIVLDSCPLPVEGSETRVVADDAQVHMTELVDSMELRRRDGFIGWYHSHPFDLETYSHCHLSATDVQTQTIWQNSSPTWLALVIDPLRSIMRQEPEFGVFRVYPPAHNPPANQCPDGTFNADQTSRTVRWGLTYNRYYCLTISYFLSELGGHLLDSMGRNNLWVRVLSSSALIESDARSRVTDRVKKVSERLNAHDTESRVGSTVLPRGGRRTAGPDDAVHAASVAASEIAIEHCKCHATQTVKAIIFDLIQRQKRREEQQVAQLLASQTTSSSTQIELMDNSA